MLLVIIIIFILAFLIWILYFAENSTINSFELLNIAEEQMKEQNLNEKERSSIITNLLK